jgi:hypothetical protein
LPGHDKYGTAMRYKILLSSNRNVCRSCPRKLSNTGVVVDPLRTKPGGKVYGSVQWRAEKVDCKELTKDSWYDLLIPRRLGLPLRFMGYKNATGYENWFVRIMSIDVDTKNTAEEVVKRGGFNCTNDKYHYFGGIILVRDDGRDLKVEDIQVLVLYVD